MNNVWVFFYGTFMCARILRHHGLNCDATFPAKVAGGCIINQVTPEHRGYLPFFTHNTYTRR